MALSRREFLRRATLAAGITIVGMGFSLGAVDAYAVDMQKNLTEATRTTTICPYCGVGCGFVVHASEGKVINIEGDVEHPINQGTACAKGASLYQFANNPNRLTKVLYRAPNATDWVEKSWPDAVAMIAQRIKSTRDATFEVTNAAGDTVNRTRAIASLGSAALDNEECWLYQKFLRGMGMVYIEHQARN